MSLKKVICTSSLYLFHSEAEYSHRHQILLGIKKLKICTHPFYNCTISGMKKFLIQCSMFQSSNTHNQNIQNN